MGFFADIIRDSRQGFPPRALSGPGEVIAAPPTPRAVDAPITFSAAIPEQAVPVLAAREVRQIREEGNGESNGQEAPSAPEILQVVAPSPSEHPPVTGLPGAKMLSLALANPVTQKHERYESARTVTDSLRPEPAGSIHAGVAGDVSFVSAHATSVHETLPECAVSSARKVTVETYGRREAGVTARAGATTPLEIAPGDAGIAESFIGSDAPAGKPRFVSDASGAEDLLPQSTRAVFAEEATAAATQPVAAEKISQPAKGSQAAMPLHVTASEPSPMATGHDRHSDQQQPSPSPPLRPQVQIGLIEVVVLTPPAAERSKHSDSRPSSDLASRHYLRNL